MKLKEKIEKEDIWCLADSSKGRIGYVSDGMPRGARVAIKDGVSEKNFVDEQGRKQGRCENYTFSLQHIDNRPIDGEGWEKVIGIYEGRQVTTWLESVSTCVDDVKNGPEIRYDRKGNIRSIANYENGKLMSTISYDHSNRVESINQWGENGRADGLQIDYGQFGERFEKPRYNFRKNGRTVAMGDLLVLKEDPVKYLKWEKEQDAEERSITLKKVLEAGTKEGKKEALKEFHSKESPAVVKRRTALKFDR